MIVCAWEEFQMALSFNPETLLTTLGILPLTVVGKELPHEPNALYVQVQGFLFREEAKGREMRSCLLLYWAWVCFKH